MELSCKCISSGLIDHDLIRKPTRFHNKKFVSTFFQVPIHRYKVEFGNLKNWTMLLNFNLVQVNYFIQKNILLKEQSVCISYMVFFNHVSKEKVLLY